MMIGLYSTWFIKIGDGPLWMKRISLEQQRCQTSWWKNLLYINNYVGNDALCMFQSWYLAGKTILTFSSVLTVSMGFTDNSSLNDILFSDFFDILEWFLKCGIRNFVFLIIRLSILRCFFGFVLGNLDKFSF